MICIYCGEKTKTANSRESMGGLRTWRRRQCNSCKVVFTTAENVDFGQAIRVKKRSRSLEPFSADKIFLEIQRSLSHRKAASEDARQLTDTVISRLLPCKTGKLDYAEIRSAVVEVLKRFDKAAAIYYKAHNTD